MKSVLAQTELKGRSYRTSANTPLRFHVRLPGGVPYKNDGGARQKFRKKNLKTPESRKVTLFKHGVSFRYITFK